MAISRQIFELWQSICERGAATRIFDPDFGDSLTDYPEYRGVCSRLAAHTPKPETTILLALRSLAVMHQEIDDQLSRSELAVTFPGGTHSVARPTHLVIRDMLQAATKEVILAGYRVTNPEILSQLHAAAKRGVQVCLICSRQEGDGTKVLTSWPSACPPPRVFEDLEDERKDTLMHIKALLVDDADLLITSANFTYSAMERNIELGIRTSGKAAREARKVLVDIAQSTAFRQLTPSS